MRGWMPDFEEEVEEELLDNEKDFNMQKTNWHNFRMLTLTGITFVVAGISAIHGMTTWSARLDVILPFLIFLEHALAGNTN